MHEKIWEIIERSEVETHVEDLIDKKFVFSSDSKEEYELELTYNISENPESPLISILERKQPFDGPAKPLYFETDSLAIDVKQLNQNQILAVGVAMAEFIKKINQITREVNE